MKAVEFAVEVGKRNSMTELSAVGRRDLMLSKTPPQHIQVGMLTTGLHSASYISRNRRPILYMWLYEGR